MSLNSVLINPDFPYYFYDNLRALLCTPDCKLSIVFCTQLPIPQYWRLIEHLKDKDKYTSPFYNLLEKIDVGQFEEEDINELLALSDIPFRWEEMFFNFEIAPIFNFENAPTFSMHISVMSHSKTEHAAHGEGKRTGEIIVHQVFGMERNARSFLCESPVNSSR